MKDRINRFNQLQQNLKTFHNSQMLDQCLNEYLSLESERRMNTRRDMFRFYFLCVTSTLTDVFLFCLRNCHWRNQQFTPLFHRSLETEKSSSSRFQNSPHSMEVGSLELLSVTMRVFFCRWPLSAEDIDLAFVGSNQDEVDLVR